MVEPQPSKLYTGVRFSSPAPFVKIVGTTDVEIKLNSKELSFFVKTKLENFSIVGVVPSYNMDKELIFLFSFNIVLEVLDSSSKILGSLSFKSLIVINLFSFIL